MLNVNVHMMKINKMIIKKLHFEPKSGTYNLIKPRKKVKSQKKEWVTIIFLHNGPM